MSMGLILLSATAQVQAQDASNPTPPPAAEKTENPTPAVGDAKSIKKPTFYSGIFSKGQEQVTLNSLTAIVIPRFAISFASYLAGIAVILLMYSGIQFMTAGGDPDKVSQATKTALYTLLGVIVAMFAYAIVFLFISIFTPS